LGKSENVGGESENVGENPKMSRGNPENVTSMKILKCWENHENVLKILKMFGKS